MTCIEINCVGPIAGYFVTFEIFLQGARCRGSTVGRQFASSTKNNTILKLSAKSKSFEANVRPSSELARSDE